MTYDPEAAERLARRLLWAFGDSPLAAEAAALILAQAAEIERLVAVLRRIGGKGNQVYCRDGHEECALLARDALN